MAQKAGRALALMLVVSASLYAAAASGSISGQVTNSSGVPQMGVAIEIVSSHSADDTTVYTDARGHYRASGLPAGAYEVRASAPSYLPSLRENLALRAGANLVVNVTLTTLFDAVQWLPPKGTSSHQDDDWQWTLRTVTSRPILRVFDDSAPNKSRNAGLKAQVAFMAGSDGEGFGSAGEMSTQFRVEQSVFSSGTLSLGGNLGYGSGMPAGIVRAAYSHEMADGSKPQVALTVRRFATADTVQHDGALEALALSVGDSFTLADFIDLNFGGEFQDINFRGSVTAFRPHGSVSVHVSPNTVIQYRYATAQPDMRAAKGFDSAPADLTESGPRVSIRDDRALLEHAHHHELSISRRLGSTKLQIAAYADNIRNAALVGVGDVTSDSGEFLPDVYSGTFTYNGGDLSTEGMRVVVERKLLPDVTGTLDYAYGGVLTLPEAGTSWEAAQSLLRVEHRHAAIAKLSGGIPHCKTRWIASYKFTSGAALTPVDMFNASAGESDSYLNIFLRQPLPAPFSLGRMEALLDVRNLLAQGYIPVVGKDGQTLYLVQSARSIRGGLAFSF